MSRNKGQVFTLDVLAAILGITIMLGITVQYQGMIKNKATQSQYQEMKTIASDAAQIAVKKTAVKEHKANTLDPGTDLSQLMNELTGEKYSYEIKGAITANEGTCNGMEEIANSRRIVKNESQEIQNLTVVICNG